MAESRSPKLEVATELPKRASYSQLAVAQRCGFKYWLRYMVGLERVTDSQPLIKGRLLHEAYDAYLFSERDRATAYGVLNLKAQEAVDDGQEPEQVAEAVEASVTVLDSFLPWSDDNDNFKLLLPNEGQEQCETSDYYELELPDGTTWPMHYKIDAHIEVDGAHLLLENKFRSRLETGGLEHDLQILLYQAFWNAQHPDDRIQGVLYNVVGPKPRKSDGAIAVRENFYRGKYEEKVALRNVAAMVMNLKSQLAGNYWPMNIRKECSWDCEFMGLCLAVRAGAKVADNIDEVNYRVSQRHQERHEDVVDD